MNCIKIKAAQLLPVKRLCCLCGEHDWSTQIWELKPHHQKDVQAHCTVPAGILFTRINMDAFHAVLSGKTKILNAKPCRHPLHAHQRGRLSIRAVRRNGAAGQGAAGARHAARAHVGAGWQRPRVAAHAAGRHGGGGAGQHRLQRGRPFARVSI